MKKFTSRIREKGKKSSASSQDLDEGDPIEDESPRSARSSIAEESQPLTKGMNGGLAGGLGPNATAEDRAARRERLKSLMGKYGKASNDDEAEQRLKPYASIFSGDGLGKLLEPMRISSNEAADLETLDEDEPSTNLRAAPSMTGGPLSRTETNDFRSSGSKRFRSQSVTKRIKSAVGRYRNRDEQKRAINLPQELARTAELELGETILRRNQALEQLRARLTARVERPARVDDAYLLRFLRSRKFDVDAAFKVIMDMERFKRENADALEGITAEEFRDLYAQGFVRVLRDYDRKGRLVSCFLPALVGPEVTQRTLLRWSVWCMEAMADDLNFQVNGATVLINFEEVNFWRGLALAGQLPPGHLTKIFRFVAECAPYRLGGIHVVNQPFYMSFLWALMLPFQSKKLRDRIFVHGHKLSLLQEEVDAEALPAEFGGTLVEDPMEWFDEQVAREAAKQLPG